MSPRPAQRQQFIYPGNGMAFVATGVSMIDPLGEDLPVKRTHARKEAGANNYPKCLRCCVSRGMRLKYLNKLRFRRKFQQRRRVLV
jgi:hypothetical protein